MSDVNDELLNLELRHQIRLHKLSNSELRKVLNILRTSENGLVAKIQTMEEAGNTASFTRRRLDALLESIRQIIADGYSRMHDYLQPQLQNLAAYEATYQATTLADTIAVNFVVAQPAEAQLKAAIADEPFDGRLLREWRDELGNAAFQKARDQIRLGFVQGETNDQIIRRIRGTRSLGYKDGVIHANRMQAESFVRTALSATANYARNEVFKENADILKGVRWCGTLDSRSCVRCSALDGKVFHLDEGPRPPLHRRCRCCMSPITKSFRELGVDLDEVPPGERASMNGTVPATETFATWIKKQSVEVQNEALGVTKAKLLRDGGLEISDFVNNQNIELTLEQLKAVEGAAFKKAGIAA